MIKRSILMILLVLPLLAKTPTIESRYIGHVTDFKILSMNDEKEVICYVQTETMRDFRIKGTNLIPYIYVGDSLFEYWIDYQLCCVGTHRYLQMYEIIKESR